MRGMRPAQLRLGLALLVAFGLVAVPGVSIGAPTRIKATANDTWNPDSAHVSPGGRVVWVNPERHDTPHDLKAYGGNWTKRVVLEPGERTGKRFRTEGSYKYYCQIHGRLVDGRCQGMCGVVHVMR